MHFLGAALVGEVNSLVLCPRQPHCFQLIVFLCFLRELFLCFHLEIPFKPYYTFALLPLPRPLPSKLSIIFGAKLRLVPYQTLCLHASSSCSCSVLPQLLYAFLNTKPLGNQSLVSQLLNFSPTLLFCLFLFGFFMLHFHFKHFSLPVPHLCSVSIS